MKQTRNAERQSPEPVTAPMPEVETSGLKLRIELLEQRLAAQSVTPILE